MPQKFLQSSDCFPMTPPKATNITFFHAFLTLLAGYRSQPRRRGAHCGQLVFASSKKDKNKNQQHKKTLQNFRKELRFNLYFFLQTLTVPAAPVALCFPVSGPNGRPRQVIEWTSQTPGQSYSSLLQGVAWRGGGSRGPGVYCLGPGDGQAPFGVPLSHRGAARESPLAGLCGVRYGAVAPTGQHNPCAV